MNYLAHIALSGRDPQVMLGNFAGDFVKGDNYLGFSPRVRAGLLLHRRIDAFTDAHPAVKRSAEPLRQAYGHYAGIMVDMFYDHFLSVFWGDYYPDITLPKFVGWAQRILLLNYFKLPGEAKKRLPYLIKSRRLERYGNLPDLERAIEIMTHRTSLPKVTAEGMRILRDNYDALADDFRGFYPVVMAMCENELKLL